MKTNAQLKNEALAALRGNWGKAVLATLVLFLLASLVSGPTIYTQSQLTEYMEENIGPHSSLRSMSSLILDPAFMAIQQRSRAASSFSTIFQILVLIPFTLGLANAFRRLLLRGETEILSISVRIATDNYWHKVWGMLLSGIFVFLWSLLLVIPGIIKLFSYSMTKYILEEYPELTASEAIDRSRAMMQGHKFDLFWLYLSFIGWALLCVLTAGIGYLWLVPYMETAEAAFYEDVKADYALHGGLI